jgi:phosphotransferase system HPr-like phosphotransfer protein
MLLSKIANAFDESQISVVFAGRKSDAKSLLELAEACIPNGAILDIQVVGGTEEVALSAVKTTVENLSLLGLQEKDSQKYTEGCRRIFVKLKMLCEAHEVAPAVVRSLGRALGLAEFSDICQRKATFRYNYGMHVFPSTLLATLKAEFKSKVELLFTRIDGMPASADLFEPVQLLGSCIKDGAEVIVKATGEDAEFAAESVRNILDHFDEIAMELQSRPGRGVAVSRSVLREYLRWPAQPGVWEPQAERKPD